MSRGYININPSMINRSELGVRLVSHHHVRRVLHVGLRVLDPSLRQAVPHPPVIHVPALEQRHVGVAPVVVPPRHQHERRL